MKMTNTVMKPDWAGATLRLDPSRFPQQVTYALRGASGDVSITIDERGAVLRKILAGRPARVPRAADTSRRVTFTKPKRLNKANAVSKIRNFVFISQI